MSARHARTIPFLGAALILILGNAGVLALNLGEHPDPPGAELGVTEFFGGANIDGSQEVHGELNLVDAPNAAGTLAVIFDKNERTLRYCITVAELTGSVTAAHFHLAPAGSEGNIVHTIQGLSGDKNEGSTEGDWADMSEENMLALFEDSIYINIYTEENPKGEIRGQLKLGNTAIAAGPQVPPGSGQLKPGKLTAIAVWYEEHRSFAYSATVSGFVGDVTGMQVRGPASDGEVGEEQYDMNVVSKSHAECLWSDVSFEQQSYVIGELMYINVETSAHEEARTKLFGLTVSEGVTPEEYEMDFERQAARDSTYEEAKERSDANFPCDTRPPPYTPTLGDSLN